SLYAFLNILGHKTHNVISLSEYAIAKIYKVVNPFEPTTSDKQRTEIDWNKCILSQDSSSESLSCPADSTRGTDELVIKRLLKVSLHLKNSVVYLSK
ncbi:Hypothetical predicted protein, partial [Paramuricea clavata]